MQGNFFQRSGILAALGVVGVLVSAAVSEAGSNLKCVQVKAAAAAPVVTAATTTTTAKVATAPSSSCCTPTWDLCCLKAKVVCIASANTCFLEKVKCSRCPDRCLVTAICNLTTALCKLQDLSPCACQSEIDQAVCCVRTASCALVKAANCTGNCDWIKTAKAIDCSVQELSCCQSCSNANG